MKMIYGGVPVNSLKVKHYEMNTNDCTMVASDLQAGITAVARGQKITGTGKSFEFASYGDLPTNVRVYVPSDINIIQIASTNNPVQLTIALKDMKNQSFITPLEVGSVFADGIAYPISVTVNEHFLSVSCELETTLEVFYGKDNYV